MNFHTLFATALCAAACCPFTLAQVAPAVLQIDLENHVLYFEDTTASDSTKYATVPGVTTPVGARNFTEARGFGDIVAVNGQRVKGTYMSGVVAGAFLRPAPTPGQAIADTLRNAMSVVTFEILKEDGTAIGTLAVIALNGGAQPPGAPAGTTGNNFIITGGTGAFLGARGQMALAPALPGVPGQRNASFNEDPANRRINGGGTWRLIAHVIPMSAPQIMTNASGPVVYHEDFSPVTAARPARAGELLIVQATGLGPTVPSVDPGHPFPADSIVQVNSPVAVTVNGQEAHVVNGVGWPGLVNTYRVDFRMPSGLTAGTASVQLSAAWMAGSAVQIPVQ